jgi:hypothetical protein
MRVPSCAGGCACTCTCPGSARAAVYVCRCPEALPAHVALGDPDTDTR